MLPITYLVLVLAFLSFLPFIKDAFKLGMIKKEREKYMHDREKYRLNGSGNGTGQ